MDALYGENIKIIKLKIVLLGDSGVGKTSYTNQLVRSTFCENLDSTIGAAYNKLYVSMKEYKLDIELWDTAGQERYKSLAPIYYRNSDIAIILYDVTNNHSKNSAIKWINVINEELPESKILLFGNKIDLVNDEINQIDISGGNIYKEVGSAKSNINIKTSLMSLLNEIDFSTSVINKNFNNQKVTLNENNKYIISYCC